jgi:hypothetical protein
MKLKKKEINEIIDGHGDLIGTDDIPTNGSDLESQAKGTSSKNAKIGTQPFRYDMLGRFGFTLMPFMEGEERNEGQEEFKNDLVDLMYEKYLDFLKYYFKNPNKLKPDYRKHVIDNGSPENTDKEWAEKVIKIVQKHFEEALNDIETIDEGVIAEKMVDKKEDEMAEKSEDKELRDKKIKKIAGLINKLEKKDIDDLINLIERENG